MTLSSPVTSLPASRLVRSRLRCRRVTPRRQRSPQRRVTGTALTVGGADIATYVPHRPGCALHPPLASMSEAVTVMDHRSTDSLTVSVESESHLTTRRAEIRAWVRQRTTDRHADDVLLACGEAVDNALEHGRPPVTVELSWVDRNGLAVVVHDSGEWIVSAAAPPRGLGFPIMMALMDMVTIDTTDGTAVRLTRRF
jgi:anti-sigma regulatory factor (Ser/Thr protein kinase)